MVAGSIIQANTSTALESVSVTSALTGEHLGHHHSFAVINETGGLTLHVHPAACVHVLQDKCPELEITGSKRSCR